MLLACFSGVYSYCILLYINVLKTELLRTVLVKSCEIPTLLSSYSFYVPGTCGKISRVCWLQRAILVGSILPLLVQRHCFSLALSFLGGIASTDICCSKPNGSWSAFLITFARTEPPKKTYQIKILTQPFIQFIQIQIFVGWNNLKSIEILFLFLRNPSMFHLVKSPMIIGQVAAALAPERRKAGGSALEAQKTGPWGMALKNPLWLGFNVYVLCMFPCYLCGSGSTLGAPKNRWLVISG